VVSPDDQILAIQGAGAYVEFLALENDSENAIVSGTLPRGKPISPNSAMISIVPLDHIDQLELYSLSVTSPTKLFTFYNYPVFGSVNYSPDNNMLASYGQGKFSYWSTSSGRELRESLPKRVNLCYTINRRDGSFIAAGSDNGVVYSDANLENFCIIQRNARTTSEKFLTDGSIMALSLQNQRIEVWTNIEGQKQEIISQTRGDVMDVAISNDGMLLVAALQGGFIEIYNLETMSIIKTIEVLTGPINHVSFTNNGNYLIAGLEDGTLRIYGTQQ